MTKDITRPETIENVHDDDEGTGIYWFVDTSAQYEQVFVPNIKRARGAELASAFAGVDGQTLDAYRWVPNQVQSAQSLVSSSCGGKCQNDLDCVDNACRCIRGRCRRK